DYAYLALLSFGPINKHHFAHSLYIKSNNILNPVMESKENIQFGKTAPSIHSSKFIPNLNKFTD
ncbi:MAG: hypothetical protein K0B06_08930, partial [Brevefilum sp.]|nr:hypothetical protein [Brevefilum sp.]